MAQCEVCGNDYDMAFEVHAQGAVHTFDSFECAIHRMAPVCEHCGCKVIGHGMQQVAASTAARTAHRAPAPRNCATGHNAGRRKRTSIAAGEGAGARAAGRPRA